ncbi:hypothetical protein CWI36_2226p0010 [Hamiltosporidium magnivora]|uniref:Uncharacterized protein n=1 Tax=Hamiltosporidium magnivora TaxID=148818 RepID=A0A4Q9KXB0_9MICR|nr:hypothetical protein CWI36_2226p0010 [Hamiltosporidium magnivora]
MRVEMHEEPIPPLKEDKREEDGVKTENMKNIIPHISEERITLEVPPKNINEGSDSEELTAVVKEVEENI